jgi:hypothetical protein
MTERDWGRLADTAIALIREADPEALAGMIHPRLGPNHGLSTIAIRRSQGRNIGRHTVIAAEDAQS